MQRPGTAHCSVREGAMLLITVLLAGAVALGVSVNLALRSVGELDMGFAGKQSLEALAVADGCAEEALRHLWQDIDYGGGTLQIGDGSCTVTVRESNGERTLDIAARIDRWTRKVRLRVDVSGTRLRILEWQQNPA